MQNDSCSIVYYMLQRINLNIILEMSCKYNIFLTHKALFLFLFSAIIKWSVPIVVGWKQTG